MCEKEENVQQSYQTFGHFVQHFLSTSVTVMPFKKVFVQFTVNFNPLIFCISYYLHNSIAYVYLFTMKLGLLLQLSTYRELLLHIMFRILYESLSFEKSSFLKMLPSVFQMWTYKR